MQEVVGDQDSRIAPQQSWEDISAQREQFECEMMQEMKEETAKKEASTAGPSTSSASARLGSKVELGGVEVRTLKKTSDFSGIELRRNLANAFEDDAVHNMDVEPQQQQQQRSEGEKDGQNETATIGRM